MENISIEQIRKDLKLIKEFYEYRLEFNNRKLKFETYIVGKVKLYNKLVKFSSCHFQYIYYNLYVKGTTQNELAEKMCYSLETVSRINNKLIKFFYSIMNIPDFVV